MRRFTLLSVLLFVSVSVVFATGNKIKAYFTMPVNTAFSRGTNAVYVNNAMEDTLISYINRTTSTLDIAIYEIAQTSSMGDVVGALNSAASRGVKVRLIYDGKDHASTSIGSLSASIHTLASPSSASYNIMHNKFVIMDAASTGNATVWTGSCNWTSTMFHNDYNNTVIIQDQPLAQAYKAEFEQMWGGATDTPNLAQSKFGPFKTATTAHTFTIDGHQVNLYFSPSDGTNSQIVNTINTADKELFFGVYTFTISTAANAISTKYSTSGMVVKGIMDQYSSGYSAYTTLVPLMGNNLKIYNGSGGTVYHSKMMIIDPDYPALDPLVLTGSHNWSSTADTKNDENTLIIHDSTIANEYLQAFAQNFINLGGSISPLTGTNDIANNELNELSVYPNPMSDHLTIHNAGNMHLTIEICDLSGRTLSSKCSEEADTNLSLESFDSGTYVVVVKSAVSTKAYTVVKM